MKKEFKRLIRGVIPYHFSQLLTPNSPNLKYYRYIKEYGYARHLFNFRHEYNDLKIDLQKDEQKNLFYVVHKNTKRLYFRRDISAEKIKDMYKELLIEQDPRSAHRYINDLSEVKGKTFLDIGSAEGFSSLDIIEKVGKVYLFERDEQWIEALQATFEPWKEKVQIIRKYISDNNENNNQTLDDFFKNKPKDHLFIKMDIEGEERKALNGGKTLFKESKALYFALSTYHKNDDATVISNFLNQFNCVYTNQMGFFRHKLRSVILKGHKLSAGIGSR